MLYRILRKVKKLITEIFSMEVRHTEEIKKYNIKIQYINTKFNKADMLTKPLDLKRFNALTEMRISEIDDLESQGTQF